LAHEAGYDAYMTGVVFLTFMKYIEVGKFLKLKETSSKEGSEKG
jgi:hypothetical protein